MKVLLLGDARALSSHIAREGHKITHDPGDSPDVAVSDIMACGLAPGVPLIVLATGTVADWTARQKRPDAVFAKTTAEAMQMVEENAPEQDDRQPEPSSKPFIVTYANKGGVGKTTTAVSIAAVLAGSGLKAVVCDFNVAAPDVATFFRLKPKCGLEKYEDIDSILMKTSDNLWILPGPADVASRQFTGEELLGIVKSLQKRFDVVVADTPPEPWTKGYMHKVFSHADLVYAVVDQSSFSIQETGIFAPTLLAMGVKPSCIRIVVNRYNPKLVGLKEIEKAFSSGFKKGTACLPKIAAVIPENWEQHIRAGYSGSILHEEEWLKLVKEVMKMRDLRYETDSVKAGWKRGLLAWLTT